MVTARRIACRSLGWALLFGIAPWASCSHPGGADDANLDFWEERFRREDAWERQLGQQLVIEGVAERTKVGPMVGGLGIEGLVEWPEDLLGKRLRAGGTLVRRDDLPVFHPDPHELPIAGIRVPVGVDLEKAKRHYLLSQAQWERIRE